MAEEVKMKTSENIQEIAKALSEFQGECPNVTKSAVNPFFKSKYATLDAILDTIRPVLKRHGLAIVQGGDYVDANMVSVTMRIIHTSGQWIESGYHLPGGDGNKFTPQSVGSAITYGRRYILSAMLGIASDEDTDANTPPIKPKTVRETVTLDAKIVDATTPEGLRKEAITLATVLSDANLISDEEYEEMVKTAREKKTVATLEKVVARIREIKREREDKAVASGEMVY